MAKQTTATCDVCQSTEIVAEVFVDSTGKRQLFDLCAVHLKELQKVLPTLTLPEEPKAE